MNLYSILLNNKEEQIKFCESLIKDVPELILYDPNRHVHDYCRIYNNTNKLYNKMVVGICTKSEVTYPMTYQCIFEIRNNVIDKWPEFTAQYTSLSDMSFNKPKNLQKFVHEWVKNYEKVLLRTYKINKIKEYEKNNRVSCP
jgi:hypothetical protein